MSDSLDKLHTKLFGRKPFLVETQVYVCLNCGKEKKKFGDYCNLTCYYEMNHPW